MHGDGRRRGGCSTVKGTSVVVVLRGRVDDRRRNSGGVFRRWSANSGEQGNGRGRRWTARYKLRRVTTANSDELHCESEEGERRESELGQAEGEGSVGVL